ncbi:hypothetical protein HK098_001724 [Nowakowskiella sp. JEL0407]|nr:hypothetical protein HK098_001724 [Nowakowskiella sp. JEL0407]
MESVKQESSNGAPMDHDAHSSGKDYNHEPESRDYRSEKSSRRRSRSRDRDRDRKRRSRSRSRSREKRRRDRGSDRDRDRPRDDRRDRDYDRRRRSRERPRHSRSVSPRERRERSITPILEKKRKLNYWDVPPAGYEGMTAEQVKNTGMFPLPGQLAKLPGTGLGLAFTLPGTDFDPNALMRGPQGAFGPVAQSASIARQARRLYCGNIPQIVQDDFGGSHVINEDDIISFFNQMMLQLKLATSPGNPVISCQINHEKNYAFVEFRSNEEATAGMAFDGMSFKGNPVKIRRPKDYQPPAEGEAAAPAVYVPGVVSTNVLDSDNKIFIGGLPAYLNEEQVMELLRAFGELRAFNLVKDTGSNLSKGYAFCEYLDPNITDIACQGLNGMDLADKKLIVQRASIGANKDKLPTYTGPPPTALLPPQPQSLDPSRVVMLLNMVTNDEVADDELWQETMEDTREECQRFGTVLNVTVPRPINGERSQWVGKVFVQFETVEEATAAIKALGGRSFASRTVVAAYFPEDRFTSGEIQ